MSSEDQTQSLTFTPSRRAFLGLGLVAGGYCLAAGPATAKAITTDPQGLDARFVMIPSADREIPAFAARPKGNHKVPVILVVQEIFGVHAYIQDICRRLAKLGYLAVAPELYVRQGDPSKFADIPSILKEVVDKVPDVQVNVDLDATLHWASQSADGDADNAAITGFCWGGRATWMYAAHNPNIKAGVAWYGRLKGPVNDLTPQYPIDVAGSLKVPVLGLYAEKDDGIPMELTEKLDRAARDSGSGSRVITFPNAPHAFHADYRPTYREEDAKKGWQMMLDWFKEHGVVPKV